MAKRSSSIGQDASREPLASVRVLVVDNSEPWRRWICSLFRTHAQLHVVGEVGDGLEAVRKARKLKPDLILLEIGLPNLNGIEAASRIVQAAHGVKIIFLTLHESAHVLRAALSNGARGYVLKSAAADELFPAIEAVLRGEKFVSRLLNQ